MENNQNNPNRDKKKSEDWLNTVQRLSREIKKSPEPLKREHRPIVRMVSDRQKVAFSQTPNFVRAVYNNDGLDHNLTPTSDNKTPMSRNVGPSDLGESSYRAGSETKSIGESKGTPEPKSNDDNSAESLRAIFAKYSKRSNKRR